MFLQLLWEGIWWPVRFSKSYDHLYIMHFEVLTTVMGSMVVQNSGHFSVYWTIGSSYWLIGSVNGLFKNINGLSVIHLSFRILILEKSIT